ncbi:MAG: glycosyltransferase family 2 protein, partial [Patescibacteria group bacterium]
MRNYSPKICAIIVTYNIGQDIFRCLNLVINQVSEVVIVDNGSDTKTVNVLRDIKKKFNKVKLIENKENLGIAAALNQGVKYAISKNYEWVLTLDHDSEVGDGMVQNMLEAFNSLNDEKKESIGIIAPNYETVKGLAYKEKFPTIISTAITSGQLVKTEIFEKIGFYKEDLFIECVDHEFCLRAKKRGFKTLLVPRAVLKQQIGMPKVYNLFFKRTVAANHSPLRYYYLYRNSIYIYKSYFTVAPGWIFKNIISNKILFLKILFFE